MRGSPLRRPGKRRRAARAASGTALAALCAGVVALARSTDWLAAFGAAASGQRLDRMRRSRQWLGGRFKNSVPTRTMTFEGAAQTLRRQVTSTATRYPPRGVPFERRVRSDFDVAPESGLRATWMGHASVLVEIGGVRMLTDPIWSDRVSPSTLVGPKRFFEPPIGLDELPPIDAVLISHDHYDHLDMKTVKSLARRTAVFLVPLGVGAHLEKWGIPAAQIREMDWGERTVVGGVTFSQTPARHFSGRRFADRDATLWCSWVIASDARRVFYSGDSGYFDGFCRIGREHGPFDLTFMNVGAYSPTWPLIHMTPEEVVQAQLDLRGGLLLPVHWGTFNLAFHDWNEPPSRTVDASARMGARVAVPKPGQMVEPSRPPRIEEWWRE